MVRSFFLHRPTRDSEDDEDDEKKGKGCTLQVLIQPFICMRRLKFKLGAKKKKSKKNKNLLLKSFIVKFHMWYWGAQLSNIKSITTVLKKPLKYTQ